MKKKDHLPYTNIVGKKKKQKQTKNRAKINEKNTHEKKGSLTLHKYCRQKKETKTNKESRKNQ